MRFTNKQYVLIATTFFLIGTFFGVILFITVRNDKGNDLQSKYNLLAKRILIENPNQPIINFQELNKKLNVYKESNLKDVKSSLYFEYLPTGTAIGLNEDQQMVGASLLKTPVAINLYKLAEDNKIDLDNKMNLKKEWLNSQFGDLYKKGEGYQISLREATKLMLRDSDNTAELMVFNSISDIVDITNFYNFIDFDYMINKDETLQLGTRSYSSILKCLYFSCYLNKDDSQELLQYLSESKYDKRLMLYINDDIKVAHKYGSFSDSVQSDCGIFYLPNKNYLLCAMINDKDPQASRYIGDLSLIVYDYMKNIPTNSQ